MTQYKRKILLSKCIFYTDCACVCIIGACRWLFNNNRQVVAVATTRATATATENRARKICMHEKWSTHAHTAHRHQPRHTHIHTPRPNQNITPIWSTKLKKKNKTTTKTVWFLYGLFAFAINENTQVCLYAAIHVRHSLDSAGHLFRSTHQNFVVDSLARSFIR